MKKNKMALVAYIIGVAILAVVIYVIPSITGLLERTYIAEYGELVVSEDVNAYFVRDETVYVAETAGKINRLAKEGQLINSGSAVVELSGSGNEDKAEKYTTLLKNLKGSTIKTSGTSSEAGYVSYYVDGYESKFTSETVSKLKETTIQGYNIGTATKVPSNKCAKGEPIFKIVSNGTWRIVFFVSSDDCTYKENNSVTLQSGDAEIDGKIETVKKGKSDSKIIITADGYFGDYLTARTEKITVIQAEAKGIIIKNSSIVKNSDTKGVLIKDKVGNNVFKPIMIKAQNEDEASVYEDYYLDADGKFVETVSIYDEVVRSPSESEITKALKDYNED